MQYKQLERFHDKLSKTSKYSEHNKKVLNDYFAWASNESADINDSTLSKYASRWYTMADVIDFKLDEATRGDTSTAVEEINNDQLKKLNGDDYSASAKKKFVNQITSFYNKFIGRKHRGYCEDIDGPLLVSRLTFTEKPSKKVVPETKANAEDIKTIAKTPDNLRDRCIIVFMFSAGARIGEVFKTQGKPEYLKWRDITFIEDHTIEVKLRKNYKKDEPHRRTVTLVLSQPLMKKLREKQNPDLDDPVFPQKDRRMYCPDCSAKANQLNNATYQRRKYGCSECSWKGYKSGCDSRKVPISDRRVRDIVKNAVQNADVTPKAQKREMDNTPHKLFRKSRALHRQAYNWKDSPLRSFFGWEEGSKVPGRYKEALKVNQKQELAKEFPDLDISIDGYFYSDALNPINCSNCGHRNSRLWDICDSCGDPITYQGTEIVEPNPESEINMLKHEAKNQVIIQQTEDPEKAKQMLEDAMQSKLEESGLDT